MPTARWGLGVAVSGSRVYAIGGGSGGSSLDTVEAHDPATDAWQARASMPGGRDTAPALLLTSNPAITSILKLEGGEISPRALAVDAAAGYAYVGDDSMPGWIIKIRLSDLSRVAALHLNAAEGHAGCGVIDGARGYAYFSVISGLAYVPGKIVRIRLSDFSHSDTLTLNANDYGAATMVIDPAAATLYLGVRSWPDRVVKVDLNSFTRVGSTKIGRAHV